MKRILVIIGFAALAIGIGIAIYFVFFRAPSVPEAQAPVSQGPEVAPGALPRAGTGGPPTPAGDSKVSPIARGGLTLASTVVANQVSSPILTSQGATQYYDRAQGKFFRLNADGSTSEISNKQFFNVQHISWSRSGSQAILEYPDGSNIVVNFQSNTQTTLPKHWTELSFNADASKIVGKSLGTTAENQFLVVADSDGSNAVAVAALGNNADRVQVAPSPTGNIIAFSRTGEAQGFGKEEILFVGTRNENFKSLLVDGIGFQGQWSASGRRLLWSASGGDSDFRPQLATAEANSGGVSPVKRTVPLATWADKCVIASDDLAYCAVPRGLPEGAGLTREAVADYPDEFYRVDLRTGATSFLAQPSEAVTAERLVISGDGSALYFTERITSQLKKLQLR